ncbi:SprT family zinc-dependent metalloprotease [Flavobacterium sp. SUN046]|uniref:M48 family metallopeptidase n=1 Tax=Flavobacterium sp. SUN046 TaxID=3002440 RepID=UPI002DB81D8B|nr:SprT family zinc-dependent metalloprotease [Flavobacterium sp. SUN046]MEC4049129.1 SprT family zinc-dependent metalloprotease [Flavobacterium sp. SUN046]
METLSISNLTIDIVRKDIKNMHLAVYPPHGRIRLSAPENTDSEMMRLFAISKIGWIKKHIKKFEAQPRETPREYISGESHFFQGKRYMLNVVERKGFNKVEIKGTKNINLYVRPNTSNEDKAIILREWYRTEMKKQIPELLSKWESIIGVKSNDWAIKQMRTKWGTCNIEAKRIWLNLELSKKPVICLEYIIVHELVHLLERNHNDKFVSYMNQFMPKWRMYKTELNKLPVAHNDWEY